MNAPTSASLPSASKDTAEADATADAGGGRELKSSERAVAVVEATVEAEAGGGGAELEGGPEKEEGDRPMDAGDEPPPSPATVFRIRLKQPPSNLRHKMRVPELCRNFSAVAWCDKLNVVACASETCARIPSSNASLPFWVPIHILNPERPTECAVFNVKADSPRDFVQFIGWSPKSCPRALLIANFHGGISIWTQPSQDPVHHVRDISTWQCEHEWRQDLAVVTKWLSGMAPIRSLPSNPSNSPNAKLSFEDKFLSRQSQTTARWPNFLCVCSVFSSGSIQLHWAQWPPPENSEPRKWFSTSKGLLGAGPSGIMAADAIITEAGTMHVAGVPLVNPSTVVVWEVTPGPGNGMNVTAKINTTSSILPPPNPPCWTGFAPLAACLFNLQECIISQEKQGKKLIDQEIMEATSLHCSPVSNFSAYVSPEAAAQSAATTTWGSGVTAVAFDPTRGGSMISVVIVEGQYMSPYDPDEGPSITGWRVQCWESSLQPVVLHPIFGNPSSFGGQTPMQTVWLTRVNKSIPPTDETTNPQPCTSSSTISDERNSSDSSIERAKRLSFDPYDLPSDVRQLAHIVYSAHGGEVAVAFLRGGVHIFSGANLNQLDSYHINVGSAIAAPAFSSSGCCLASVWHDTSKDRTTLKIFRVLPPAIPSNQSKVSSAAWERAIADRFWWCLLSEVDWWDAIGCTQSAAEDGIVSLNSVIAVLDVDFHSLPSIQHRQQYGPSLDRIKCRLLEGTNAQDVRALVLDMQARLLLDMLCKGIESALINPGTLLPDPWQASGETLASIEADRMVVDQSLVPCIQAYVDAVLDLASHFITRLRRYASFCRTLASHAVGASSGTGSARNVVASPPHTTASPATSQVIKLTASAVSKVEDAQGIRSGQLVVGAKSFDEGHPGKSIRLGSGNAGQGYTSEEVKVLFLILVDLCRRTAALQHPLPASQVGSSNIIIRLHYIDGNYTVLPEMVEASLGPHMQNMPRPRGADAAGLLLRELELHPPAEEWHRRNMFGGPWSDPGDSGPLDYSAKSKLAVSDSYISKFDESGNDFSASQCFWPRKRRLSERDAAFGLKTSVGLGTCLGIMGSRRDVVTATWKTGLEGVWFKCIRCPRQTCAFGQQGSSSPMNEREAWWTGRWVHGCPMCGGTWVRVV
ncbi:hypothetical protein HPP92_028517 [Vanilla planifolia]|uniref:Mediator of RNA polymerase II transcription subunit 16 n=1 Tax=Vanilla planifolia TaxID=51239 RepID=A0A835U5P0_VANPL|nr:hypothetical protein HPP92_028517 [Vanilla planifolia]